MQAGDRARPGQGLMVNQLWEQQPVHCWGLFFPLSPIPSLLSLYTCPVGTLLPNKELSRLYFCP